MAKQQDITVFQGDNWAAMVTVSNPDRTPADLTGYTAKAQMREGIADQSWFVAAEFTCAVVLPNLISLSLTSDQTTLLRQSAYLWDLQVVSPAGIVSTLLGGAVQILFEVTRIVQTPISPVDARQLAEADALRRNR
ncbi:MAG TPA: hypothetical protein VNW90_25150 [Acetobacteraceae bacterium]|jgi:hypothetical protein|nr:hypothetical protein [Acetobacteraceae bacterium]